VVQVKSVNSAIQEDRIQALKGLMHEGDYGLFVTLSDYTKNAKKFLEDNPRIRGINGPEFVGLFLKYYKQLDDKYRDMIPLKEVFIPVPKE
jgi:restriction system protein